MAYYAPDLTGTNSAYQVTNDRYEIFSATQRIVFDGPIYLTSLVIVINGTVLSPFIQNTDWSITDETDIDYTAQSKMMVLDPAFNATLINAIEIISPTTPPYQISCQYQKLWPVPSKVVVSASGSVEFTPDLLISILQRLGAVEATVQAVPNVNALGTGNPVLLPLDQNMTNQTNAVQETHTVNVFNNQNLIQPTCGPFFASSVSITIPGNTTPLVNGTDYLIVGVDVTRTRATNVQTSVNRFILVTKPYSGALQVNVHAYGGDVTLYDMTAVYAMIQNVNTFLGNNSVLTPDLLGSSAPFLSVLSRVTALETNLRNLINTGNPDYSDVTGNGTAVLQKIRSVDTNLHWWSIASLYLVSGSTQVVTADRMHFRMQLLNANLMADVFVAFNPALTNPFDIDSVAVSQNLGYVPFTSYGTSSVCTPQFRILWGTGNASQTGALLQIGLELPGLTESLSIQDLSGNQSAWILAPSQGATAILPTDTMVPLPNTTYTWDTTIAGSQSALHMMPNKTGYLAWGGALSVGSMTTTPNTLSVLLDASFNINDITRVRLQFTTADNSTVVTADANMAAFQTAGTITGQVYIPNEVVDETDILMQVVVTNTGTALTLTVTPDHIPSTTTLNLRHAFFMLT